MKTLKFIAVVLITMLSLSIYAQHRPMPMYNKKNKQMQWITNLPKQDLSTDEKNMLIKMREEEKFASDVYTFLADKWQMPIFQHIARAEKRHSQAIKNLLTKYEINDPVQAPGKFSDTKLQKLYDQLTQQGAKSLKDALIVGATIEDMDINDLNTHLQKTDNDDIRIVFMNIKQGAYHHLRAFTNKLNLYYEYEYTPKYITKKEYEKIKQYGPRYNQGMPMDNDEN